MKVTLKPSEEIIQPALTETSVTDSRGRVIKLKKPGVLGQFRFVETLGDAAKNQVYMGMTLPLIYVAEIDGDPVDFPVTKREVEALIQRLDDDGIDAVMTGVNQYFGKKSDEAEKEAIKK